MDEGAAQQVEPAAYSLEAVPGGEPPERFAAFIRSETAKWTKLAKEAGISAE